MAARTAPPVWLAHADTPVRTPARCPFADATSQQAGARSLGDAVRCLVNRERLRAIGQVLAWGCGSLSTPAAAVRRWLASPPHRHVVLSRAYTVTGAGVADGAPEQGCGMPGTTMVALFGRPG